MANISAAELLVDPDFVDPCTVLRNALTVGENGMGVVTLTCIPILASIQAQSGDDLFTNEDLARTQGSYEVITTFPLVTATDTTEADIVVWGGRQFRVVSIGRFGNFANGRGHYEGIMEIMSVTPAESDLTLWDNGATTWDGGATQWDMTGADQTKWDGAATTWDSAATEWPA
jgi:hypothetical protein